MSPPLAISASRRLQRNYSSIHRSAPLFFDAATHYCYKVVDRDDENQSQTNPTRNIFNNTTTMRRHYSCIQHYEPLSHLSNNASTFSPTKREYHTTSRKEILPFIAAGVLGLTTVYTYRALVQMDKDWDEYYDAVEKYKAETGIDPEAPKQIEAKSKSK